MLKVEKLIFLNSLMEKNLDLFLFPEIHYDLIASERLINTIEQNKLSGIEISEAEFI